MTDPNRDELVKLLPCPFCNHDTPCTIEGCDRWYVACGNPHCFCALGEIYDRDAMPNHHFASEQDAITAWNTRAAKALSATTGGEDEIEAVARAIHDVDYPSDQFPTSPDDEWRNNLMDQARAAIGAMRRLAPTAGWRLVPIEPTEEMFGGLARDIVMWDRFDLHNGRGLFKHLRSIGRAIPDWLRKEIPETDQVPPKGTVAACIYKAMLEEAPISPTPSGEGK